MLCRFTDRLPTQHSVPFAPTAAEALQHHAGGLGTVNDSVAAPLEVVTERVGGRALVPFWYEADTESV